MKSKYRELLAVMLSIMGIGLLMLVEPALASIWESQPELGRNRGELHIIAKHDMHYTAAAPSVLDGACEVYAVDLIGAWVDAGAKEGTFPFESLNENACTGDFEADVLPLFSQSGTWFEGSEACTDCHFDNSEDSRHEMDLSSLEGIMRGGDVLSEPPGVAIVIPGDWDNSKLRARLRNNRMPPGWEFDIEETNRDGPLLEVDGGEIYAVDLIAAWVNDGIPEGEFTWLDMDETEHTSDFYTDVLPLFTTNDIWFEGSESCTNCHFDNSEDSRHEMDMSSYEGIMMGGDVLSEPPGVPIVVSGDWDASKLKARLRNNRMPPGWEFDIEETNRDGPVVLAGQLAELNAHMGSGETAVSILSGDCDIYAVDLIGAWVDAGAELGGFPFESVNSETCTGDFETDVLPLFTNDNAWFEGSESCTNCHFDNSEDSRHEMDLSSLEGIMRGGDVLSEPPGVAIVIPGDWDNSKLRARLRNNRMPPGWEFDIEETNRDGPLLEVDGGEIYAVDLIAAWVNDGIPEGEFTWLDMDETEHTGDFDTDVLPLFTTNDIWFEGSESCTNCHFDNSEDSRHEMDMSSYEGIMMGGDVLSEPPGVPIVVSGDWDASKLKARLRDNRMPPGWEFDIEETNRDGPLVSAGVNDAASEPHTGGGAATAVLFGECDTYAVDLIGAWVDAGADAAPFLFTSTDGQDCQAEFETDVLPLFTEDNAWFEGSESCINCHFDNSEDSRHEMDLSSLEGIMRGGDVLSEPPGVAIVIPGDWDASKLRERLRNNRMPPGWEFDIEETNRDGPLMEMDGGEIYAVDLIAAWVNGGIPDGEFTWVDMDENEHTADFDADVLPLFTTDNIWFEGSESCVNCHFDNSEDSRHEMDLSSYEGIMMGGDVLSEPPGVAIVVSGDWDASKLKARLRNNRMPPGWEFDIEETNRDGPMIQAGIVLAVDGVVPVNGEVPTSPDTIVLAAEAPPPPPLPDPVVTETIQQANISIMFLVLFGGITLVFGIGMAFVFGNQIGKSDDNVSKTVFVLALVFAIVAIITAALLLHGLETGTFTKTVTVEIDSPFAVEVAPVIPAVAEVRVEEWQAKIPDSYAKLENPYTGDLEAAQLGQMVFDSHDCYECHGETLQGDGNFSAGLMPKPVNLTDPQLMNLPFMTDTYLFWRISEGGSHAPFLSAMPAWKNTIPEDERWQLVAFIRSQAANEAVDEGEQAAIAIIEQNGCFACHRLDHIGRGGKIGPAWSELPEVAASRQEGMSAADYVRKSIIDPASFIVPGYEEASVMTPDFAEKMSEEEIDMLVEYLLGLPDD